MAMAMIALAGAFIGIYLTLYHYGYVGTLACSATETISCERVQASRWSMLFGLPVATWGLGFYLLVLALTLAGIQPRFATSRRLSIALLLLTGWGVLFSSWLTYLEKFRIHAWCEWCLASAGLVAILFVLALLDWRDARAS
jgi:uncharacterized membrane protein